MTARHQNPEVEKLVDELFGMVHTAQGYAFCSDGETFASVPDFFARIRGRLKWSQEASRLMHRFLKAHDQLGGRRQVNGAPSLIKPPAHG